MFHELLYAQNSAFSEYLINPVSGGSVESYGLMRFFVVSNLIMRTVDKRPTIGTVSFPTHRCPSVAQIYDGGAFI